MLCATRDVRAEVAGAFSMPISVAGKSNTVISDATRGLTLTILLSIFAINFMDRQILAILVEPIKHDLELSDTQVGVLYGLAFAVLYSTAGIPIARLADRWNRAWIINCSLVLFSVMTAACGLASGYWQLVISRVGVAIGEGGTNPPSHSIISDLYAVDRRSTAMAIFSLGPHVGIILGFIIGGVVGQFFGWRVAFVSAGVLGLIFSLLSFRRLQEPSRESFMAQPVEAPPIGAVVRKLFRYNSMVHLFVGAAVWSTAAYAVIGWLASFLVRSHGLSISAAGTYLAIILGLLGGVGTVLGGLLADRLAVRNAAWRFRVVGIAGLVMASGWALAMWETRTTFALVLLVVPGGLFGFYLGPTFAMVQSLVEPPMRATAAAALLFVINIVGLGVGPVAVGALSDALQPSSQMLKLGRAFATGS
jgi:predicted MFS family arabinose efflux permease